MIWTQILLFKSFQVWVFRLFWYMVKQSQAHQEETEHLKDTIAENTKVLAELTTLIKVLTDEKER